MTFPNTRDLERWISYIDEHIKGLQEFRGQLQGFLEEPQPRERSRSRVLKEPRKTTGGRRSSGDSKKWRDDPISEKQIAFMEEKNIEFWDGMRKGEASDAIDAFIKSKGGR